jgi:hypothetical protein
MRGKLGEMEGWFQADYVQSAGVSQMDLTSASSLAKFSTISNTSYNSSDDTMITATISNTSTDLTE